MDNYDLDTADGMANAILWTQNLVNQLRQGGAWVVPRSGTMLTVDHRGKEVIITEGFLPDPGIARVFRAMGWTVLIIHKEEDTEQ